MTAIRRLLSALVIAAGLLAITTTRAAACSCVAPGTPQEELARSSAVFSGTVVAREVPSAGPGVSSTEPVTITIQVSQVWKGPVAAQVVVHTAQETASCGYPFEVGQEYLVYTYDDEGQLGVSLCSRTSLLSDASEDLAALGAGEVPAPAGPASPTSGLPALPLIVIGLTSLAVIAIALVVVRRGRASGTRR